MPAKSDAQKRFMYAVKGYKSGKTTDVSKKVKDAAKSMSMSSVDDFLHQENKEPESEFGPCLKCGMEEVECTELETPCCDECNHSFFSENVDIKDMSLKSLVPEEFLGTKKLPSAYRLNYSDNSGMDIQNALMLAKNLMIKFDSVSCEPKSDALLILSDPERSGDVQSYLSQTGYKLAKQPISDVYDKQNEDLVNTNMISPLVKHHIKDLDDGKNKRKPWQKDNSIKSVK